MSNFMAKICVLNEIPLRDLIQDRKIKLFCDQERRTFTTSLVDTFFTRHAISPGSIENVFSYTGSYIIFEYINGKFLSVDKNHLLEIHIDDVSPTNGRWFILLSRETHNYVISEFYLRYVIISDDPEEMVMWKLTDELTEVEDISSDKKWIKKFTNFNFLDYCETKRLLNNS